MPRDFSRVGLILLALFSVLFLSAGKASADIGLFQYTGPQWSVSTCESYGYSSPPCTTGNITATFLLDGLSPGFNGTLNSSNVLAFTGTTNPGQSFNVNNLGGVSFTFTNGIITYWSFGATDYPNGTFQSAPNDEDEAQEGLITPIYMGVIFNPPNGTWVNPDVLGSPCGRPGAASCGEPIDLGSGNVFEQVQDYTTAGQNPLSFSRYYNSLSNPGTYAVSLGYNWRGTFDRYLHIIPATSVVGVEVERPDGQVIMFSSNAGTYTTDSDIDYSLTVSGTTWTLTDPDDTSEVYYQSGGEGVLQSIKLRDGYTQTMHYTGSELSSVTDTYGRTLGLTYSSTGSLTGLTTPDSLSLTYGYVAYSSYGLLTSVAYNTTPATSQTYLYQSGYPTALTGIVDENGIEFSSWGYDGQGRAISSQIGTGTTNADLTKVSYDDSTGNRTVTGPLGVQETYKFTNLQGVPKVTEIDRAANGTVQYASQLFTYDSNGYTASQTDWNGNQTAFTNNSHGLPTQIVYASGSAVTHTTNITYDSVWTRLPHIITTPGLTTTINYDSSGNALTQVLADTTTQSVPYSTNGQTRTWTYTYTSTGQLTSIKLPRTDVSAKTAFNYVGGALTYTSDALGHKTTINTYLGGGLPTKITDPNNVITALAYSGRLWLTSSTLYVSSGTLTTNFTYDSTGNLTKQTLPDGSYLSYGYDTAHRLDQITNRLGETQGLTLDSAGNLTNALWKNASAATTRQHGATFDAAGRQLTDVGGMSQTTTYGYDAQGNVTSIQSPLLNTATQTFDALNRLTGYTDAAINFTSTSYDAHDRPTAIKDPKGNITSYVYDGFGEAIQEKSPDRGTTVWYYNADGDVTQKTDGNGFVTNWTYDALDRPLTRTYPADSTLNVAFTYDQGGHGFGIGRLTSLTDQAGSLSLTYEQRGLVTSNARTISSTAYTTGYSYESAGRLSSITYASSGWIVSYGRDNAGQVNFVSSTQPSHAATNLASSITHMPFGPVSGFTFGNGVTDARTFDQDYRMTGVKDANGASSIYYLSYGYDADNNVKTITDNVTSADSQTLNYDVIDRLTSAAGAYGTISSITYDSNSNRKTYGSTSYTIPSTSDRMSAAGSSSISYLSNGGNISAIGSTTTMTYSKANRLATVAVSGTTSTYTYDAFGQRLKAVVGAAVPNIYTFDQDGDMLNESNGGVGTDYAYLEDPNGYGPFPVAAIQTAAATISAITTDKIGTAQRATNASKAIVWTGNYDPNGAVSPTASITMNYRLPGQHADANGLYYNLFRDNNPAYATGGGRYIETDPLGLAGGSTNLYPYALNNTYRLTDRSGLIASPWVIGMSAVAGGVIGYNVPNGGVKTAIVGAVGMGVGAALTPASGFEAATGTARILTIATASGTASGLTTVAINLTNQDPNIFNDAGPSFAAGFAVPWLSGEVLAGGLGLVAENSLAANVLSFNSNLLGIGASILDNGISGQGADPYLPAVVRAGEESASGPYGGGILLNTQGPCQGPGPRLR